MNPSPGELPATLPLLQELRAAGALDEPAFAAAVERVAAAPSVGAWARFGDRLLAILGGVLLATSVIYLVAWNWDDLDRLTQLVLLQAALVGAAGITLWRGAASASGQAGLLVAFLLCGAELAFFGQTWQTGKDPWELFAAWAALTLPWAVVARSPALWALQSVLWNLTLGLYWTEMVRPILSEGAVWYAHAAGTLNGAGWLAVAVLGRLGRTRALWPGHLWLFVAVLLFGGTISGWIFLPELYDEGAVWAVPGYLLVLGSAVLFGAVLAIDTGALAIASFGVVLVSGAVLGRFAWEATSRAQDELAAIVLFFLVGLALTAEVAASAWLIARLSRRRGPHDAPATGSEP